MRTPFGPQPSAANNQRNDSQWGAGNWAYSKRPSASQPAPGQAQSIAPKSQGTPYPSYSVPQAKGGGATGGYGAYRPAPFQAAPAQTPWGPSNDPFVERTAFINQINQQRMQNQLAFNTGGATNPAAGLTPGIDYQKAMQQAGLGNGAPSMSPNYGDSMISRLNQSFGGQGNPFAFAPQSAPQFAGMYAAGTDLTKLPFTDTMQPNPAYRPPVTPYQQPADPYASTTYAYPGGTWGHSPHQGQPTPSQGTQSGSRLSEWAAAGKPGNPEIQLMQIGKSRIDGTGFGSISEAAAYDRWLESQGGPSKPPYYQPGVPSPPSQKLTTMPPQGKTPMDAKTKQFWKDDLSSPRVKDWAMNTEGPAAGNARQKMQELERGDDRNGWTLMQRPRQVRA